MESGQSFKLIERDQHQNLLISLMRLMHMRVVHHKQQEQQRCQDAEYKHDDHFGP